MPIEQLLSDRVRFNSVVSVQIKNNESFTVPTGEVHAVTVIVDPAVRLKINGTVIVLDGSDDGADSFSAVLNSGDTLSADKGTNTNDGVAIQGFEVSQ
jgi:hypothetical protein